MPKFSIVRLAMTSFHAKQWKKNALMWPQSMVDRLRPHGLMARTSPADSPVWVDHFSFSDKLPLEDYLKKVLPDIILETTAGHSKGVPAPSLHQLVRMPSDKLWAYMAKEFVWQEDNIYSYSRGSRVMDMLVECGNTLAMEYVPAKWWSIWLKNTNQNDFANVHPQSLLWLLSRGYLEQHQLKLPSYAFTSECIDHMPMIPTNMMVSSSYVSDMVVAWIKKFDLDDEQKASLLFRLLNVYGLTEYSSKLAPTLSSWLQPQEVIVLPLWQALEKNPISYRVADNQENINNVHPALAALSCLHPTNTWMDIYKLFKFVLSANQESSYTYPCFEEELIKSNNIVHIEQSPYT